MKMYIPEEFISYVWKNRLFNQDNLETTDGQPIRILHTGILNNNQGPDFLQAKIQVGEMLLVGNVELHVNASDWHKHGHNKDKAYHNIILHVVYNEDKIIFDNTHQPMLTLELNGKIFPSLLNKYAQINKDKSVLKCKTFIDKLDAKELLKIESWKERMVVARMTRKSNLILDDLALFNNDWSQMLFASFGKYLGGTLNGEAFYQLCKSIPLMVLHKYRISLLSIEAILFGQAGMLEENIEDAYYQSLKNEYAYFKKVYHLQPLKSEMWKFFRLRPTSFPTIRIAQLSFIMHQYFSFSLSDLELSHWNENLQSIHASSFWDNHYVFEKETKQCQVKSLGKQVVEGLQINVMIPFKMAYNKSQGNHEAISDSLELLHGIYKEENGISKLWREVGFKSVDAYDTQAFNEWTNQYCLKGRCIECAMGNMILKSSYSVIEHNENSIFKERNSKWKLKNQERFLI